MNQDFDFLEVAPSEEHIAQVLRKAEGAMAQRRAQLRRARVSSFLQWFTASAGLATAAYVGVVMLKRRQELRGQISESNIDPLAFSDIGLDTELLADLPMSDMESFGLLEEDLDLLESSEDV